MHLRLEFREFVSYRFRIDFARLREGFTRAILPNVKSRSCSLRNGALIHADLKGFTSISEKLGSLGKKGTEQLTELLNNCFGAILEPIEKAGGDVLYFAGDSVTARLPRGEDASTCVSGIRSCLAGLGSVKTEAGEITPRASVLSGIGSWFESELLHRGRAHVLLSGALVAGMAEAAAEGREDAPGVSRRKPWSGPPSAAKTPKAPVGHSPEHRSVVALFIKLAGYDIASPPIDALRKSFRILSEIAEKYGGTLHLVDSMVTGGCRMFLLFGAPVSSGRDGRNAVLAGIEALDALEGQECLYPSAGISCGYAYYGLVGNHWRRSFTVIGDGVNTAARLCDTAPRGSVVVSGEVRRETREFFVFKPLSSVWAKGKKRALSRFVPSPGEPLHHYRCGFVGRARELDHLTGRAAVRGVVMEITGEAGVGKTRLLSQLCTNLSARGVRIVSVRPDEPRRTDEHLSSLVAGICGINSGDSARVKRSKLRETLRSAGGDELAALESFPGGMLFGLSYPGKAYGALPPKLRRENLRDCLKAMLTLLREPSLFVIEDLHLLSAEEIVELSRLLRDVQAIGGPPVLLSRRPEGHPMVTGEELALETMELSGLSDEESMSLVHSILGGGDLDPMAGEILRSRSEGNPFFLLQITLFLLENRLLERRENVWVTSRDYSEDSIPENIFSMIMARMDQLRPEAKDFLRTAAVSGSDFSLRLVAEVLERPVESDARDCIKARLVHPVSGDDGDFVFSHVLVRDVAYDSMLRRDRRSVHRRLGEVMERGGAPPSILAHHFRRGEVPASAVIHSLRAGRIAAERYMNEEALQHFTAAADLAENLPDFTNSLVEAWEGIARIRDTLGDYDLALEAHRNVVAMSASVETRSVAKEAMAEIFYVRGEIDRALDYICDIEKTVEGSEAEYPEIFARNASFRAWAMCVRGSLEEAMEYALKAVAYGETAGPEGLPTLGKTLNTLATVYWVKDDMESAGIYYRKALEIAEKLGKYREAAITLGNISLIYHRQGRFLESIDCVTRNLGIAREIGDKFMVNNCHGQLTLPMLRVGNVSEARLHCREYLRMSEELGSTHDLLLALSADGSIALEARDFRRLFHSSGRLREVASMTGMDRELWKAGNLRGRAALLTGDHDLARRELAEALSTVERLKDPANTASLLGAVARERALSGDTEEAVALVDRASALAGECDSEMLRAGVQVERANILGITGDVEEGVRCLEEALSVYLKHGALLDVAAAEHHLGGLHLRRKTGADSGHAFLASAIERFASMGLTKRVEESASLLSR